MESRVNALPIKLQELLNKNSELIVNYLISEAEKYKHIGLMFEEECNTTRLFFPKEVVKKSPIFKIEKLLGEESVLASITQLFTEWEPVLHKNNIESLSHFISDFFNPIETSNVWTDFWIKQQKKNYKIVRIK